MRQSIYQLLRDAINAEQPVVLATVLDGPDVGLQWLVRPDMPVVTACADDMLNHMVAQHSLTMLNRDEQGVQIVADRQIFVESYPPPPTLIMVGAVHIAVELTTFAKTMGFRTVVIDARGAFATAERFAHADELVHAWPDDALKGRLHPNCAVVVLTHDPKLDDPALLVALPSNARYVGALGSKKTHAARVERLREAGIDDGAIARLHAPIGIPIGGRTPVEIALSIIAEVVAVRNGKREQLRGA
jgi:xanthine dehydrogenase accessory factor